MSSLEGLTEPAVVLLNRDLRVHDHPALATACREHKHVVPLFVIDDLLLETRFASPNRAPILVDALLDLRSALKQRGGDLVVRRGDPVREALAVAREAGARSIYASADVSTFARRREERLEAACAEAGLEFRLFPGVTVVPFDALTTTSGSYYRVFTPFWRAWKAQPWRAVENPPPRVSIPAELEPGALPGSHDLVAGTRSPSLPTGGESEARSVLRRFTRTGLAEYANARDTPAAEGTSRLGMHLHFGCISPLEVATKLIDRPGGESFLRQLCWRDYYHQLTHGFPALATQDFRSRGDDWIDDKESLAAWREGQTGYPIIDAGMRQLHQEGWMHNRARMLVASFLTKHLGIDWRLGAQHFFRLLVDGDVPNNTGNWQWIAGTGTDTRPNRILNPLRQAARFDPAGDYVRRYVPELDELPDSEIHQPWTLGTRKLAELAYPDRIINHEIAAQDFRERAAARR